MTKLTLLYLTIALGIGAALALPFARKVKTNGGSKNLITTRFSAKPLDESTRE